jgi:hypothetical protein
MALRTYNLPSDAWDLIICLPDVLKYDFGEVEEAMLQVVERPYVHIFCILSIEKSDLGEIACDVLFRRMPLRTFDFPSGRLKNRLSRSRWCDVSRRRKAMRTHFLHPQHQKKRVGRSSLSDVLRMRMGMRTLTLPSGSLKIQLWWSRWSDVSRFRKAMRPNFLHPGHQKSVLEEVS